MSQAILDPEVGGGDPEFEDDAPAKPARKVDPTFKRNIMIIGAVVVIAVVALVTVVMLASGGKKKVPGATGVGVGESGAVIPTDGNQPLTPVMKDYLTKAQVEARAKAERDGDKVSLPSDTLASPEPLKDKPTETVLQTANHQPTNGAGPAYAGPSAEDQARMERRRAGLQTQMGALMDVREMYVTGASAERVPNAYVQPTQVATGAPVAGSGGVVNGPGAQATPAGKLIADALEIFPAEVASEVDTYKSNYCSTRIVAGRLAGAFLVGNCETKEDGLSMNFTQMRFSGQTYAISAIALDESTSNKALSNTTVDRRYLQRFVFPVFTASLGGYAAAKSQTAQTVISNGGGTTQSTSAATSAQAIAAGVAAGMGVLNAVVATEAGKPMQITMKDGLPLGIMFLKPVNLLNGGAAGYIN